ncbi:hypothetical protein FVE85_2011 [Porphyridium purpureum]|uniref:Uncharacterized protein n=1 Tax=Porphyridium purpureum TaxID=35688 RepID=A0A5J4YWZ2_PORPP|nr:hypothetical protein FVE85_2011 [Porphyridium purpureum]|eukprot:POR2541..scf209_3
MGMIVYTQHNKNFSHIFLDDGTHTGDASQAVQLRCCIEDSEAYSVAVRDELGERSNEWLDSELNRTRFDLRVGMVVQMLGRLRRKKATLVSDEWVLQVVVSHAQLMAGAVGAEDRMRIEYMQLWDEVYRPGNSWLHTVPDSFWIYLFKEISDSARASEISRLCTEYGDEVVRSRNLDALVRPTVHELTKGALHALEEQHDVRSHSYTELVKQKAEFFLSYSPE